MAHQAIFHLKGQEEEGINAFATCWMDRETLSCCENCEQFVGIHVKVMKDKITFSCHCIPYPTIGLSRKLCSKSLQKKNKG